MPFREAQRLWFGSTRVGFEFVPEPHRRDLLEPQLQKFPARVEKFPLWEAGRQYVGRNLATLAAVRLLAA